MPSCGGISRDEANQPDDASESALAVVFGPFGSLPDPTGQLTRKSMRPSVTFLLIRHGQQMAPWGPLSQLTERGLLQAAALASELAMGPALAAVYSSPLPRAAATAQAIVASLSLALNLEPRLAEFELGTKSLDEVAERGDLFIWRPDDKGSDGETLGAFSRRVGDFCDEIAARHSGERIAVVSHAGTIDAMVRWAIGIAPESVWQHELELQHGSITEIEFWPQGRVSGGSPRYTVFRRLNYTAHLGELVSDL